MILAWLCRFKPAFGQQLHFSGEQTKHKEQWWTLPRSPDIDPMLF